MIWNAGNQNSEFEKADQNPLMNSIYLICKGFPSMPNANLFIAF